MYKKIITIIICTISLINVMAQEPVGTKTKNSKIKIIFSAYEKTKETIAILGDVNRHKVIDIGNTQKQIRKFRSIKIDDKDKDIRKMKKKLDITLEVVYILKCESLLGYELLHKEISSPYFKYPPSVKIISKSGKATVNPKCLKDPKVLKAYNKAIEDYEQKKKMYLWNSKLKKMISFHKKLLFFPLKHASRERATSRIPLIIACIHDKDKQKEWLAQILKTIKSNKKTIKSNKKTKTK